MNLSFFKKLYLFLLSWNEASVSSHFLDGWFFAGQHVQNEA